MDGFISKKYYDGCRVYLKDGRTISMFNEACIYRECIIMGMNHNKYKDSVNADCKGINKGKHNLKGIGFEEEK